MQTWEYLTVMQRMDPKTGEVVPVPGQPDPQAAGADGWELVTITEAVRVGNTQAVYLWFKRPKS